MRIECGRVYVFFFFLESGKSTHEVCRVIVCNGLSIDVGLVHISVLLVFVQISRDKENVQ